MHHVVIDMEYGDARKYLRQKEKDVVIATVTHQYV